MKILITGGAGFIGLHLARRLLEEGHAVRILDNFSSQVHGPHGSLPSHLAGRVSLLKGSVSDKATTWAALENQECVIHLAAETGTGQSMYEIEKYNETNIRGTALLCDYLVNARPHRVRKLILASSRAVYGEGKYICRQHGVVFPGMRSIADMKSGQYEPRCRLCGKVCEPSPTDEDSLCAPLSFYGLTKQVQEQMILLFAGCTEITAFALRLQNVYGPGQSLHNAYTGILAIFSSRARTGAPINIFEDGLETRDFVYIDDVVEAIMLCLKSDTPTPEVINVGSGIATSVNAVVREITAYFNSSSPVRVSGDFRVGDIRHNVAALAKAGKLLGYAPRWSFARGIKSFLDWASTQPCEENHYDNSLQEMRRHRMMFAEGHHDPGRASG
jgi:dTDP-L-rhamnose 4-epimerase